MILIDASNIKVGGGATLLSYLSQFAEDQNIDHVIMVNEDLDMPIASSEQFVTRGSFFSRTKELREALAKVTPSQLFCFGNYPPSQRLSGIPVVTYFHNPYLAGRVNLPFYNIRKRAGYFLKSIYLKSNVRNSDYYLFQTNAFKNRFAQVYRFDDKCCRKLPFFDDKIADAYLAGQDVRKVDDRFIYISGANDHKNHGILLDVWHKLAIEHQRYPELYLTIEQHQRSLLERIQMVNAQGGRITNLGILEQDELFKYTASCEYHIFPSLLETLGLGMVESVMLGCKLIASDLDVVQEVVKPSLTFDPLDIQSMTDAVLRCLKGNVGPSQVLLENKISDMFHFIRQLN